MYTLLYTSTDGFTYRYKYSRTEEGVRKHYERFLTLPDFQTATDIWIERRDAVVTITRMEEYQ